MIPPEGLAIKFGIEGSAGNGGGVWSGLIGLLIEVLSRFLTISIAVWSKLGSSGSIIDRILGSTGTLALVPISPEITQTILTIKVITITITNSILFILNF